MWAKRLLYLTQQEKHVGKVATMIDTQEMQKTGGNP